MMSNSYFNTGSQWNAEVDTDNESSTGSNIEQQRIKSALPYNWLGRSRAKVAPISDDDEKKDALSITSSISKTIICYNMVRSRI